MPGTLAPTIWTVFDNNGNVCPGALIHTTLAGLATLVDVYTDAALTIPHTNPVECDAAGRAIMYLDALSYRFRVCDADDAQLFVVDPIQGVQAGQTNLGEVFAFGGDSNSPITATSYPVGHLDTSSCHAGTALFVMDTANLPAGTYKLRGTLQSVSGSVTVTAALVNLSDGASETPLATISSSYAAGGVPVTSGAITFAAAGGADKVYGIKVEVSGAGVGFAWGISLIRTA